MDLPHQPVLCSLEPLPTLSGIIALFYSLQIPSQIGALLGYILHHTRGQKIKLDLVVNLLFWQVNYMILNSIHPYLSRLLSSLLLQWCTACTTFKLANKPHSSWQLPTMHFRCYFLEIENWDDYLRYVKHMHKVCSKVFLFATIITIKFYIWTPEAGLEHGPWLGYLLLRKGEKCVKINWQTIAELHISQVLPFQQMIEDIWIDSKFRRLSVVRLVATLGWN